VAAGRYADIGDQDLDAYVAALGLPGTPGCLEHLWGCVAPQMFLYCPGSAPFRR
jgi:hypothetical protein